jgi:hypothetical protein
MAKLALRLKSMPRRRFIQQKLQVKADRPAAAAATKLRKEGRSSRKAKVKQRNEAKHFASGSVASGLKSASASCKAISKLALHERKSIALVFQ